jgi:TRAP-type transport system periplasmic protein
VKKIKLGLMLSAMLSVAGSGASAADAVHLKLAMFSPDTEMTWVKVIKPWADAVNAAGKGVIQIDPYPNGALGRALPQQAQMVLDDVADIAFVIPGVTPGRFADNEVMDLPGLFDTSKEATQTYVDLMKADLLHSFDKYHVIGVMATPPFWIDARAKITSLADLKGKKIRGTNASQSATLKALGAVPVLMPVSDVPEAIGRGTIDGATEFPGPLTDFGIDRVTKYDLELPVGVSSLTLLMNKAKYDALSAQARAVLDKFGPDWIANQFQTSYGAYLSDLYKRLAQEPKRVQTKPSAAEMTEANKVFQAVVAAWSGKSAENAALVKAAADDVAKIRKN